MVNHYRIDISHKTIFFVAAFTGLLWVLFEIKEVLVVLFIAIILTAAFSPIVNFLEKKWHLPKILGIVITYIIIFSLIGGLIYLVVNPLVDQTNSFIRSIPKTIDTLAPNSSINKEIVQQELTNLSGNAFKFTLAIFNNFIALVSIVVLTFYMLLERHNLDKLIGQFFTQKEKRVKEVVNKIEEKLGAWLRGQVILSLIIGFLVWISMTLLGVPYALPLAIIAGVLEVVPVIGPIISAVPAVLLAFLISPYLALAVVGVFFGIQQLENHLIVPQVMKKAVGLNPLIVILAVAIGGKLLGVSGALLAVPIPVVLQIVVEDALKQVHED